MKRRAKMACPECGSTRSKVYESRGSDAGVKRNRECECGYRFTTVETVLGPVMRGKPAASRLQEGREAELVKATGRLFSVLIDAQR